MTPFAAGLRRSVFVSGLAFCAGLAGFADRAEACRCKKVEPHQHIQAYDVIATVTVDETRLVNRSRARKNGVAFVSVKRVWKGPEAKKLKVHFDGDFGVTPSHSCTHGFPHAQEFFLFAKIDGDTLYTTECALAPARGFENKDKYEAALQSFVDNGRKIKRTPKFIKE